MKESSESVCWGIFMALLITMAVFVSGLILSSCSRDVVRVVEKTRVDTLYTASKDRDSIFVHDSIYERVEARNDTIYINKFRTRTGYRDKLRTDIIYRVKVDSIPYPVEVEKEVNRLYWWQTALMWAGGIALLLLILFIAVRFH